MVEEVVLDEVALADAHLTEEAHVLASILDFLTTGYPGFPHEAVKRMMNEKIDGELQNKS